MKNLVPEDKRIFNRPSNDRPISEFFDPPAGRFENGDAWTGYKYQENDAWYFRATDKNGNEYDTDEVPATSPLFTLTQYIGNWTGEEIDKVN